MFYASEYVTYYSPKSGEETSNTCSYKTFDNITDAINHNQKRFDDMFPLGIRGNVKVRGNVSGKIVVDSYYDTPESEELHNKRFVRHMLTVNEDKPF